MKLINLFRRKPRLYRTPGGPVYTLFEDMAKQPHLLIAGATGSGKSVIINGIIYNLLHRGPGKAGLILIDPKKTELLKYANLPHTLMYADNTVTMLQALEYAKRITDSRYKEMQRKGWTEFQEGDVYVFIDELAALMTSQKKTVFPILQNLGMIARPTHVHMICSTQTVNAEILPTPLTCNFDSRVALRTSTAQQSRMIIGVNGCETFPSPKLENRALCYYRTGANLYKYIVPMYSEEQYDKIIDWWTSSKCIAK